MGISSCSLKPRHCFRDTGILATCPIRISNDVVLTKSLFCPRELLLLRTDSGTGFRERHNANVGMGIPECPGHSVALCVVHCALVFGVFLTQRLNVVLQKLAIGMPLFVLHYHVGRPTM